MIEDASRYRALQAIRLQTEDPTIATLKQGCSAKGGAEIATVSQGKS